MATINFRESSRNDWTRPGGATPEDAKLGCLQRIADATELMANDHARLIRDLDYAERSRKSWMEDCGRLSRKNKTLRGVITKLKKQIPQKL